MEVIVGMEVVVVMGVVGGMEVVVAMVMEIRAMVLRRRRRKRV